jgi:hypothetical protein
MLYANDFFPVNFRKMAHNVPAVYDVFAAAMKKLRSSFSSRKMWVEAGVGMSEANDLASRNPVAP